MLGCTLEEIAELMPDWDGGQCAPIQSQLRDLVKRKLTETEARAAETRAFTADLERILAGLGPHTPDGPCDADCGCLTDTPAVPVAATRTSGPVACTLNAAEIPGRLQEWRDVVGHVVDRVPVDGGTRLQLDTDVPLDQLALLVAAEQGCCAASSPSPSPWTAGVWRWRCVRRRRARRWSTPCSQARHEPQRRLKVAGVGAVACAACCAGPILGLLTATGLATIAGFVMFGVAAVALGIVLVALILLGPVGRGLDLAAGDPADTPRRR